MEDSCPQTAMEMVAGRGEEVMASQIFLSPATLWGILSSEYVQSRPNETNDADNGWLDVAGREAETDEDGRDTESDGYTEEPFAEPGIRPDVLWSFRPSDISSQAAFNERLPPEVEALDREGTNKLWSAAGYNVEPTPEDNGAASAMRDATIINDEVGGPSEIYHPPIGPYKIKKADGKGQGVYVSRDIPRGTRILVDKPFFAVTKPYSLSTITDKFEQMSFTRRQLYMQFCCPDRPDDRQMSDVTRIFEANCFNINYSAAIFRTATRFNHSCVPNTYYAWSEARQELIFQAMIDVKQEEELTIAYGRPFLSQRERQNELRNYNFKCNCPACQSYTPFGQASESRRLVMKDLDAQIFTCQTALNEGLPTNDLQDLLSLILRLIELVKEEGLGGELMAPYRGASELLKGRGDWEDALVFANKQLEEERTCLGEDSEVVGKTREYVHELEKMTGKRRLLGESEEPEKTEMDDSDVRGMESTEHDPIPLGPEQHLRT
ncbi:hypothetical protein BDR22DRAFT_892789 [Usnea florida]